MKEEVNRWTRISQDGSRELAHTNLTTLNSLYIWAGLSLFTLKSSGRASYMETHLKCGHGVS